MTINNTKSVFPTKVEAEASIALAQLCQLRDVYNDGWKPDWSSNSLKSCIYAWKDKIDPGLFSFTNKILTFKTSELRDEFLKNFKSLIETAKPLL